MTHAPSNEEFRVAERQAAPTTIEAVMYSLRERGEAAFAEDDCQGRLRTLSKEQLARWWTGLLNCVPAILPLPTR
jgi:hypothetical protein